ncbi:MAG TPA: helix-turn-helix domain-containing protein [Thermoanaerobaculia bacterium]|nr:helix-turn-helix domain-containing protein [Thermoanaerobaculia bacterium]
MSHDRDAVRTSILDAAERLLGRYGYRKMTVEDIATEAAIGKGTVYLSFPSKEEVVLGTVDRIVDAVCAEMTRLAAAKGEVSNRLRAMLMARVLIRFDRVSSYRASLSDLLSAIRTSLLERREQHFAREIEILAGTIREGQLAGEIAPGSPRRLARSILLATNNFLPYALSPRELGERDALRRDAGDVADLLVAALRSTPNEPAAAGRTAAVSKGAHR